MLHGTYNDIQYIMGKNEHNEQSFNSYTALLQSELKREKQKTLKKLQQEYNEKRAIKIEQLVNGEEIFFTEEEIAEAAMQKIGSGTAKEDVANLFKQVQSQMSEYSSVVSSLEAFIKAQQGALPAGSSIEVDSSFLDKVINDLSIAENYKSSGKFYNLLGNLGEATSLAAETAITNGLIDLVTDRLKIDSQFVKATATVQNTGTQTYNNTRVQTDNQLKIHFSFADNILADFSELSQGLSLTVNISDKANKKVATIDSKRRRATNSLTFRSSTVETLMQDMPKRVKSATYNLISYHRQGKELTGFLTTSPGFALRKYLGYKLLQKMFLSEGELNKVNFTVYGTSVYAEREVYSKLFSNEDILADIEYWTLKELVGKFKGGTAEENLKAGTAEANKRIDKMKVAIRASLKLK